MNLESIVSLVCHIAVTFSGISEFIDASKTLALKTEVLGNDKASCKAFILAACNFR